MVGQIVDADEMYYNLELLAQCKRVRLERVKCILEDERPVESVSMYGAGATTPMLTG